jgi:hypothetical protein
MAKDEKKSDPLVLAQEAADKASGERNVFYHQVHKCNGVAVGNGEFEKHAAPNGFEYDEKAWIEGGRKGPAKLKKLEVPGLNAPAEPAAEKPKSG